MHLVLNVQGDLEQEVEDTWGYLDSDANGHSCSLSSYSSSCRLSPAAACLAAGAEWSHHTLGLQFVGRELLHGHPLI